MKMSKTLHARLKAYAANGAVLGLLPEPLSWDANICRNENGTLNVTYSPLALHGGILARPLTDGLEIAIEVSDGTGEWMEPDNCRFVIVGQSRNRKDGTQTVTLTGITYTWLLNKAKGLNLDALIKEGDNAGKRPFLSANPGRIVKTLLDENQARGGIPITCGFDAGKDSANTAWARIMTLYYDPGVSVMTALDNLAANGVCDWVSRRRQLLMYNTDSPALCRDLSDSIRIDLPRQTLDAPDEASIEDLASTVLVKGDNIAFTASNPSAPTPWGKWELYLQQGGVSDQGTAELLMQSTLDEAARLRAQYTRQILTTNVAHLPLVDYHPGDWISTPLSGGMEKARVVRVVLAQDKRGVKASIMLNDRLYDAQTRQAKRVQGIVGGAVAGGAQGGRPAPEQDHRAPKAPVGVVCTSDAYLTSYGQSRGVISMQWAAVTQATDNTAIDIQAYDIQYRRNIAGAPWESAGRTTMTSIGIDNLVCGQQYAVRVRAIPTYSDHIGEWSEQSVVLVAHDITPCSVPSKPLLYSELGVVQVQWDGKTDLGTQMEADFDHCEVGLYNEQGLMTVADTLSAAPAISVITDLIPASTVRIALRSVDHAGNLSKWSEVAEIVVSNTVSLEEIAQINKDIRDNADKLNAAKDDLDQAKGDIAANKSNIQTTKNDLNTVNNTLNTVKGDLSTAQDDIKQTKEDLKKTNETLSTVSNDVATAKNDIKTAKEDIKTNATKAQNAYTAATNAQTTADGKNKIIKRALEPDHTNLKPGDMWYRTQPLTWWTGEPNNSPSILDLRENHVEETLMWDGTQFNQYDFVAHNIIATGTITTPLIAANAIIADKIGANAVTSDKIMAGSINTDKLVAGSITAEKIAANAVSADKLAANSVVAGKISAGAVTTEKLAALAVTTEKLAAGSVIADKISTNAVTAEKISASAISAEKIVANAVTTEKLAALAVTAEKLAAGSVNADKIVSNAITSDKISANAVTAVKIATNAVTTDKIASNAITSDKIAAGAITAGMITAGTIKDKYSRNSWDLDAGVLKTTQGTIGGLDIQSGYIGNDVFRLNSSGVGFYENESYIGKIGTNHYTNDASKRGLVFDLDTAGSYMSWGSKPSSSSTYYSMKLSYIRNAFASFTANTLAVSCPIDGQNYTAKNLYLDPDTAGARGGISTTIDYVQVLEMKSDGTVAKWGPSAQLVFKRGMLVGCKSYRK
ncbi:hypothetical protein PG2006B_1093 [Bifidobacterium animalis subsp. animalis]|uniref:hypothetical protein n=1 Tax=Bifidobacterium animalis TaxID=28025 RepID=UPI00101F5447|nr:hypothetical protein [Bifidobacterium animalis]RYN13519.1 hypothetical protein PG2006B_1093 [Bifidobacterium animalis subsp. animalis]